MTLGAKKYRNCWGFGSFWNRLAVNNQGCSTCQMRSYGSASVVSRAKVCNYSWRGRGGICRAARPRLTLRMMSLADFVQTKGFGSRVTANAALLAHMLGSLTRATRIVTHCVIRYTRAVSDQVDSKR